MKNSIILTLLISTNFLLKGSGTAEINTSSLSASTYSSFTGYMYVANEGSGGGGTEITQISANGTAVVIGTGFNGPSGLTTDGSTLYISDDSPHIYTLTSAGVITPIYDATNFTNPNALTFYSATGGTEYLFVADAGNKIIRIDLTTGALVELASGFDHPQAVTIDVSENVYFTDFTGHVYKIESSATLPVTPATATQYASNVVPYTEGGLVIDSNGDMYVSSYGDGKVIKITPNGTGSATTELVDFSDCLTRGLVLSPDEETLFISCYDTHKIIELNLPTSNLSVFADPVSTSNLLFGPFGILITDNNYPEFDGDGDGLNFYPPTCLYTCTDFDTITSETTPSQFCTWLDGIIDSNCSCESDELDKLKMLDWMCEGCLAAEAAGTGTCEDWLDFDGDHSHHDDCDLDCSTECTDQDGDSDIDTDDYPVIDPLSVGKSGCNCYCDCNANTLYDVGEPCGEGGPPECAADCMDSSDQSLDDFSTFTYVEECNWVNSIMDEYNTSPTTSCIYDCAAEEIEEMIIYDHICDGCLAAESVESGSCEYWFYDSDDYTTQTCSDSNACNNGSAGTCYYAENGYDCDGSCSGGDSAVDTCGICGGDGTSCANQSISLSIGTVTSTTMEILINHTMPLSGFQFEISGITLESISGGVAASNFTVSSSSITNMVLGYSISASELPATNGEIVLTNITYSAINTEACLINEVFGIGNYAGGNYTLTVGSCATLTCPLDDADVCGVCGGSGVDATTNCCSDGIGPNDETSDCAGICGGTDTTCIDCAGIQNGTAYTDNCHQCVGGNTGDNPCAADCTGTYGGTAKEDVCGNCGGNCVGVEGVYVSCDGISGTSCSTLAIDKLEGIPTDYHIQSIYPNPFNPTTNITYGLAENTYVKIAVYNISGKQIDTLIEEFQVTGYYNITWDASLYASGIYYIQLDAGNYTEIRKITFLK